MRTSVKERDSGSLFSGRRAKSQNSGSGGSMDPDGYHNSTTMD